jgi:pseudouridine-5'-monophosphatase
MCSWYLKPQALVVALKSSMVSIISDKLQQAHCLANAKYFIFDCDGLILDTEPLYTQAAFGLARELGYSGAADQFPPPYKLAIMGRHREAVAAHVLDYFQREHRFNPGMCPRTWADRVAQYEYDLFSRPLSVLSGAPELIRLLQTRGIPFALATSSNRKAFLVKSQTHRALFSAFNLIICGDDSDPSDEGCDPESRPKLSERLKPNPWIFNYAARELTRTEEALLPRTHGFVLEDSPNGVLAGVRSGHAVIWVPSAEVKCAVHEDPTGVLRRAIEAEKLDVDPATWPPIFLCDSLEQVYRALLLHPAA